MTDALVGHEHEDDERHLETVLGPLLVTRVFGLLRAMRIYDMANQVVRDQLRETLALVEEAMEDEVALVAMGECFYVNGARVRAEPSKVPLFSALSAEFEQRHLGGVRFMDGLRSEELGAFMRLFLDHADAKRGPELVAAAAGAGIVHVVPITVEELQSAEIEQGRPDDTEPSSDRERARRSYQQALRGTKAAILRTVRTGRPAIRRVKRVVQPLVDSTMKNEFSVVGMVAIKNHDEYTYAHCVNVSILSIAMGQTLGMSRGTLANLGVGSILHDIGKLAVPVEVLAKPGQLTQEEWGLVRRHPLEGARAIMRMPGLAPLTRDALDVALYHHRRADGSGYPKVAGAGPPPLMSRIVAVADCYDAMTSHRSYRKRPFTGHEVLSTLLGQDRNLFDAAVLWALVQTVGLYPAGTLLETRSGHIVLSINNDREDLRRPHCRVLAYPGGRPAMDGRPILWEPMPRDEAVARVVPPEEFEVAIDRLLAA